MANAIETQGFTFTIASNPGTSPSNFTAVGEIVSFSFFDGAAAEIDVTHLQSTAKEWIMGLQDFGSGTLECNHLPSDAGQNLMRAAKASRDIQDFKLTLSNGTIYSFRGYVLSAPITGGVDAKVDGSFQIRISGDVTKT